MLLLKFVNFFSNEHQLRNATGEPPLLPRNANSSLEPPPPACVTHFVDGPKWGRRSLLKFSVTIHESGDCHDRRFRFFSLLISSIYVCFFYHLQLFWSEFVKIVPFLDIGIIQTFRNVINSVTHELAHTSWFMYFQFYRVRRRKNSNYEWWWKRS